MADMFADEDSARFFQVVQMLQHEGRGNELEWRHYAGCFQNVSARVDFTHLVEELDIEYRLCLIKLPHSKDVVMIISMLQYIRR